MPGGNFRQHIESFIYWDNVNAGSNLATMYTCVSLATPGEVTTANAAGVAGNWGDIVVPTPVGTVGGITAATRRVIGVLGETQYNGKQVNVVVDGVAYVQANAAIGTGDGVPLHVVNVESRTDAQTPFTDAPEQLMAHDPRFTLTYNLALIDDPAMTAQSTGSNVQYFPVGYALEVSNAKYNIIAVELANKPLWM